MLRLTQIRLPLDHEPDDLKIKILEMLKIKPNVLQSFEIFRRGYDARKKKDIQLIYTLDVAVEDEARVLNHSHHNPQIKKKPDTAYHPVAKAPSDLTERPVVVGMGPCGLFAALLLAQMGFRPIVLERGKSVRERTIDTFAFWKKGVLNPESNVQFGEGGAGTFSDGKLYSQIKDKQNRARKVMQEFVNAGAPPEILMLSKPHIGTLKLVNILEKMRETLISLGAEIRFESRVDDLLIEDQQIQAVHLANGETIQAKHLVLALGHSARDTFALLQKRGIDLEKKAFSIGFRIEHSQDLLDDARFGPFAGHQKLGAADYKLVHHCKNGRSVYSFCMCPGGTVVASSSEAGTVVTNGMSQYSRQEHNANSGIVVNLSPSDYSGGPLAGIAFQQKWEQKAFELGGKNYRAPAQRVGDFLANRPSQHWGEIEASYRPGVQLANLNKALPEYAIEAIREALPIFNQKLGGAMSNDSLLIAVETRTSSPIRIPRNADLESTNTQGLYPAGEGAGYAGGILSAAVDGIKVAEAIALKITSDSKNN